MDHEAVSQFLDAASPVFDPQSIGRAAWCAGASHNAYSMLMNDMAPGAAMRTVVVWWADGSLDAFVHPEHLSTEDAVDTVVSELEQKLKTSDVPSAVVLAFNGEGLVSVPRFKEDHNG